ncbi:hypothetical protein GJAV_G00090470 [Gymnothorax javanicus]|nr:hypothetical protein GJAV_G00090470 [Gymnothorax javanicus]
MDPSGSEQPVGSSEADCTTVLAAEGGREGAEPEWFEHSAYERAESSYQRWLAGQWRPEPPDPDLNSLHGDQAGCHRQVSAMWVSAGACLPDFGPAERHPLVELPHTVLHTATAAPHFDRGAVPASSPGPAPKRRSRSGQPRLAPERQKNVRVEKPSHDQAGPASQAHSNDHAHSHGRGHAHSRRGGAPRGRGRGQRWQRKRWWSEGDGGSPWRQYGAQPSMTAVQYLSQEKIWFDKSRYDEAERRFYEGTNGPSHVSQGTFFASGDQDELVSRMRSLELENQSLQSVVEDLRSALLNLESRVALLERIPTASPPIQTAPVQLQKARALEEENGGDDDDDDVDLFGSDEEDDEEAERIREERLKAYAEKKAQKPALIAKSSILLDVKPWDDETDMLKLEECVRSVQADGLLWGCSKLVPVGYGIKKLQIQCVVEDDKVGTDMLEEEITKFEDYVQSVDVAAFNKI